MECQPARRPGRRCDSPSRPGRYPSRWMCFRWPCNASAGSWPKRPWPRWISWESPCWRPPALLSASQSTFALKRTWNEPPLLNVIIVAPPGKTKSPVIRAVVKPLSEIDRRMREDSAQNEPRGRNARRPTPRTIASRRRDRNRLNCERSSRTSRESHWSSSWPTILAGFCAILTRLPPGLPRSTSTRGRVAQTASSGSRSGALPPSPSIARGDANRPTLLSLSSPSWVACPPTCSPACATSEAE